MRNPHWLNSHRLLLYPAALLVAYCAGGLLWLSVLRSYFPLPAQDSPFADDFKVFWGASYLALQGHAASAYDLDRLLAALRIAAPGLGKAQAWFRWFYPPTYELVVLPLALLPVILSYAMFVFTTLSAYLALLHRIVSGYRIHLLVLAFPPTLITLFHGQNAFLTATLAGLGMLLLESNPVWSGVCIGLLVIKPHLAVLFPLALLCARAWKALGAAAATAICLSGLSIAVLGTDTAPAFLRSLHIAFVADAAGSLPLPKVMTMFSAARLLGADVRLASVLQAGMALVGALSVLALWRRAVPLGLKAAGLLTASLLVSPHVFDYDLTWLALPLAWFTLDGLKRGWLTWERELLVCVWISPVLSEGAAAFCSVQFEPLVLVLLLAALLRRAHMLPHHGSLWVGTA
jgi:hypothetical protein